MSMRVGELSRRTGVGVSTLRAWEARFRFLEPHRSPAGHRLYDEIDVDRVNAVVRLVEEGLTLASAIARVATAGAAALPTGAAEDLLLLQILDAVGEGIWVVRHGRTRFANRRMAELMGYTVDELVGLPILDIFDPAELPLVKKRTELAKDGERLHFRQNLRRADGSTFLAEINTTPVFNRAGRYEGGVALVTDITTRGAAETHARLQATLLDHLTDAVVIEGADERILYVNAAAERLFDLSAADVVGGPGPDVLPAADGAEETSGTKTLLRGEKAFSGRLALSRRDGRRLSAHVTTAPVTDEHGGLLGVVGIVSDETARDRREMELLRRERQLQTLAVLGAAALREREDPRPGPSSLVTEALDATLLLLLADQVAVFAVDADAAELRAWAVEPPIADRRAVPAGGGSLVGYTALARKVVIVDDASLERRFEPSALPGGVPVASAIGAPVFGPDCIVGVIVAESSTAHRFDPRDGHFLQGIANIVGAALSAPGP
jgi:PAS domain S-box-containing protein